MTNEVTCPPERSAAESKDPAVAPTGMATGFLDYARNGNAGCSSFELRTCFVIAW
jgi:hypothetical protein